MSIPTALQSFWDDYARHDASADPRRFYEAFGFGDSAQMADELGALVLRGTKRATAAAAWAYEAEGRRPPQPGDLSIVTDGAGQPLCVIETREVEIVAFRGVDAAFAAAEGEGDGSLAHWRQEHTAFFTRQCSRAGRSFDEQMPVVCERFVLVYGRDWPTAHDVLRFWFEEIRPAQWWKVDPAFDRLVETRFGALHRRAAQAELHTWRASPEGRLAEVIVLDQFSRNIHRGDRRAFEGDPLALGLAQEAVAAGADLALPEARRVFLYMPYMHSESALIHRQAERLFRERAPADNLDFELRHKAIIDRYGRYPHRNAALGRASTADEEAFLQQPGSRF